MPHRQLTVGQGVELGLDDLQGQVLVALGGQDEAQPRAVVGGESAIPRPGAFGVIRPSASRNLILETET
jgi:hypothetical protein